MRSSKDSAFVILMADDDIDDRLLVTEAFAESCKFDELKFVGDGLELLDYLRSEGIYAETPVDLPNLILLDLNMPRMNGLEALEKIKSDPKLRLIPVVVLSTSNSQTDIVSCYSLGAASFLTKPSTFADMTSMMSVLGNYWMKFVEFPAGADRC